MLRDEFVMVESLPFWQRKKLEEMSDEEWESLCDGCGQCCLNKLIDADTEEIYFTNVACNLLNIKNCQCRHYEKRFEYEPDCIKLTRDNLLTFDWLPFSCAYRRLNEGKPLPTWHPLITGSKVAMHAAKASVRHIAIPESRMTQWENHIIERYALGIEE